MSAPMRRLFCLQSRLLLRCANCRVFVTNRSHQYLAKSWNLLKLHDRGIFQNIYPEVRTEELHKVLKKGPQAVYCGFDPTADSLHVGHLLTIMALLHCQRGGHAVIPVIGGATAQVGDPSGRTKERVPLKSEEIQHNTLSIYESLTRIFDNHEKYFWDEGGKSLGETKIKNNNEWYRDVNLVEFLSVFGRQFRLGNMLSRHSVQSRLDSAQGMSFTEFSYQILQAYDWWYLYKHDRCTIQIGGNDQIGNIMSGHDLISRTTSKPVWGLTVPLITSTTGDKLGKTSGNALWLNADRTSPYELYQYFLRLADSVVENYLKQFTFYRDDVIENIVTKHMEEPEKRLGQQKIAEQVTILVHGESGLESARRCTEALFNSSAQKLAELSDTELSELFKNTPVSELTMVPGTTVFDLVMNAHCFNRAVDAERVIKEGGVHINHQRADQADHVLMLGQHILPNGISLIRIGKKNYYLVKWLELGTFGMDR